jgi:hypothetical protein
MPVIEAQRLFHHDENKVRDHRGISSACCVVLVSLILTPAIFHDGRA